MSKPGASRDRGNPYYDIDQEFRKQDERFQDVNRNIRRHDRQYQSLETRARHTERSIDEQDDLITGQQQTIDSMVYDAKLRSSKKERRKTEGPPLSDFALLIIGVLGVAFALSASRFF